MRTNVIGFSKSIFAIFLLAVLFFATSVAVYAEQPPECASGEHEYSVTITKEPTESENGERTYKCDICGYSYTTPIPLLGHKWGEWVTDKEPTCCTEGHRYRVCTKYPDSPHTQEEIIPATGVHDYVATITKNATCEEDGVKTFTCSYCGGTYTEPIPALGHQFGEWVTDIKPTEEKEGHRYRVCSNDSTHVEEEVLPVLSKPAAKTEPVQTNQTDKTDRINVMDFVLSIGFLGMMSGFGCAIYSDLRLIFWMRKKRKSFLEKKSGEYSNI